jgi:putative SOS response-associated peptidase YedK
MAGRYDLHRSPREVALAMGLPSPPPLVPRYNIAPTQDIPVVRIAAGGEREMVTMRWGFVPRWARDPAIGLKMINARGETVATNKAFGIAFKRHRCLIPADGFYEWAKLAGGRKQPMRATMKDGVTFAFGGVAERWLSPTGDVLDSCAIITVDANELLAPILERMPVIIAPDEYERWLDSTIESPLDLVAPYPAEAMQVYPVSTRGDATRNDDPALIEAVDLLSPETASAQKPRKDDEQQDTKEVAEGAANKTGNTDENATDDVTEDAVEDTPRQENLF